MAADAHWAFLLYPLFFKCNWQLHLIREFSHVFSVRVVLSHRDGTSKPRTRIETSSYNEDPELTAQLHRTLADFEADLAGEVKVTCRETCKYHFKTQI